MYPTRIACRPQTGHRVARHAGPACSRGMSSGFFPPAPFFSPGRHGPHPFAGGNSGFGDIAPIIRIVDDATRVFENFPFGAPSRRQSRPHQQIREPRFDVREVDDAYELRGELPGVESKNLDVEFTDANTLVIRGRVETEHTAGTHPEAAQAEPAATPAVDNKGAADVSETASVHSNDSTSSYVKPTVEDEEITGESNTVVANEKSPTATSTTEKAAPEQEQQQPEQATPQYWLHERSTGTFERTFAFAARVDHDGVTASLRNGILNVTVPKAPEPAARRITVQ